MRANFPVIRVKDIQKVYPAGEWESWLKNSNSFGTEAKGAGFVTNADDLGNEAITTAENIEVLRLDYPGSAYSASEGYVRLTIKDVNGRGIEVKHPFDRADINDGVPLIGNIFAIIVQRAFSLTINFAPAH